MVGVVGVPQVVGIRRHAVQPRKADSQPRRNENRRKHEKDAEADQQVSPQRGVPRAVLEEADKWRAGATRESRKMAVSSHE